MQNDSLTAGDRPCTHLFKRPRDSRLTGCRNGKLHPLVGGDHRCNGEWNKVSMHFYKSAVLRTFRTTDTLKVMAAIIAHTQDTSELKERSNKYHSYNRHTIRIIVWITNGTRPNRDLTRTHP